MLPPRGPSDLALVLVGDLPALEGDCACPTPPVVAAPATLSAAPYALAADLYAAELAPGWSLACNTLGGGPPAALTAAARQALAAFAAAAPLSTPLHRRLAEARLITPAGTAAGAPTGQPDTLTAWLHVTNACNLDCPYCYVRKSAARMELEAGRAALEAIFATAARRGFRAVKLKYAGGEAALHYRMVQQLHAYAEQLGAADGIAVRAVVLSNGTVMPEPFAEWLAASGVRLMLSVDGAGADHDAQRPWKGGGSGAFAALERNLDARLLPRGIRPDICITVTGRTAHSAHTAVSWAIGRDLPFSLNFYRESEQSAGFRELRIEEGQIIAGLLRAYAAVEAALPARPFLDGLLDRVQAAAHGHTCGVGRNYLVITHEGKLAQCQMELQGAQRIEPGADLIALVAAGPIHNVSVDEKEGCRSCTWRYRCAGGCPIVTLRATGRTDVRSPNCNIYKALLPAALRLEGLRILKVNGYLPAGAS